MTRLSCISLYSTGPKSDNFGAKKTKKLIPHRKILIPFLVAFTALDRFLGGYGPQTKQTDMSLFLDMSTEFLNVRMLV